MNWSMKSMLYWGITYMPFLVIVTWTSTKCLFQSMLPCSVAFCQVLPMYWFNLFIAIQMMRYRVDIRKKNFEKSSLQLSCFVLISVFLAVVNVATIVLLCNLIEKLDIAANGDWFIHINGNEMFHAWKHCLNSCLIMFKSLCCNIFIYIQHAERFQQCKIKKEVFFLIQITICWRKVYSITLVFYGLMVYYCHPTSRNLHNIW